MTREIRLNIACACCVLLGACGGTPAGNPAGPTSINPPSGDSSLGVAYNYDESVSADDRQLISDAIQLAQRTFTEQFHRDVRGRVTVNVRGTSCGFTASASGSTITVCTLHPGWVGATAARRMSIMGHELFHVLQQQYSWPRTWWLWEGAAEYAGLAAVILNGAISYQDVVVCEVGVYLNNGGHSIPSLDQFSNDNNFNGAAYSTAWLAWDRLLDGLNGLPKMSQMLSGAGFQNVYGISEQAFVSEFDQYRRTLVRPGGTCRLHGSTSGPTPPQVIARDDAYRVSRATRTTVPAPGLLVNDSIPSGFTGSVRFVHPLPPRLSLENHGGTGSFTVDFSSDPGFTGVVIFQYQVIVGATSSNAATVTLTVQ